MRRALSERRAALGEEDLAASIAAFVAALEAVRARVPSWSLDGGEFELLAGGFRLT